jgi:hypothetical protein
VHGLQSQSVLKRLPSCAHGQKAEREEGKTAE